MATHMQDIYNISSVWKYFTVSNKKKEKLDYILEPLQSITQLCLLSFCPIGSKLTIHDNILQIQLPSMTQGIIRYFNDDNKDDLYYLFNVFRRFLSYYKFLESNHKFNALFNILITMAVNGLDKLIQTYSDSNRISVLHTLQMYKIMLQKKDFFNTNDNTSTNPVAIRNKTHIDNNIDNIFCNIVKIYDNEEYYLIYNILLSCNKYPANIENYINSMNFIMIPFNDKIKKWINDNIAL
jgi:hypothetical protein